jgi:helicase
MEKIASLKKLKDRLEAINLSENYENVQDLITELHFAYESFRLGRTLPSISDERTLWDIAYYLLTALTNSQRKKVVNLEAQEEGLAISGLVFELLGRFAQARGDFELSQSCLFNAAIANTLSRYEANAAVLAKSYFDKDKSFESLADFLRFPSSYGMNAIFALLAREFFWVRKTIPSAIQSIDASLEYTWSPNPDKEPTEEQKFWLLICKGIRSFCDFMVDGEENNYHSAIGSVKSARNYSLERNMLTEHWISSRLLDCIQRMYSRSVWHILREQEFSERYISTLTRFPWNPVHELWQSQIDALTNVETPKSLSRDNYLSDDIKQVLVSMPTSAGKTLLAELAIIKVLENNQGAKCVYVAPSRALVDEIESKLHRRFRLLDYKVASVVGGFEVDIADPTYLEENIDVAVLTPEKLDHLFRKRDPFVDRIALIIFDEIHKVSEGYRGWFLETLITWLMLKPKMRNAKMIYMTPVLPRSQQPVVRLWLGGQVAAPAVTTDWSPTRQLIGLLWYEQLKPDWRHPIECDKQGKRCYYGASANLTFRYDIGTKHRTLSGLYNEPFWVKEVNDKFKRVKHDTRYDRCYRLINLLDAKQSILVYFQQKIDLVRFCKRAEEYLEQLENETLVRLQEYITRRLGRGFPLVSCLPYGVAFHHGDLPLDVRAEIEKAYKEKAIRILACTTTLAEGVNLPIQTFILGYPQTFGGYRISITDFRNIIGRAGRALIETEGHVFAISHPEISRDQEKSQYLGSLLDLEESKSSLDSGFVPYRYRQNEAEVVKELDALANAIKDAQSLARQEYKETMAERLQRLQVLIFALYEDEIIGNDPSSLKKALHRTLLFKTDTNYETQQAIFKLGERFQAVCSEMDSNRLRCFNISGLSYRSNILLEELAANIVQRCADLSSKEYTFENVVGDKGLAFILQEIQEARPKRSEFRAKQYNVIKQLNHYGVLSDWLNGANFGQIRDSYFYGLSNLAERTEACQGYISRQFTFKLPWVLSALQVHVKPFGNSSLNWWLETLPAQVKYGVNSPEAVYLSSVGIHSRFLAIALGQLYRQEYGLVLEDDWESLGEWFRSLSPFYLRSKIPDLPTLAIRQAIQRANTVRPQSRKLRQSKRITFNISGWQHYDGETAIDDLLYLASGVDKPEVELYSEPDNFYDEFAIEIYWNDLKLGYVPRIYNEEIAVLQALGREIGAIIMTIGSKRPDGWRPVKIMAELLPLRR